MAAAVAAVDAVAEEGVKYTIPITEKPRAL